MKRHYAYQMLAMTAVGFTLVVSGCSPVYQATTTGPVALLQNNNSLLIFQDPKTCTQPVPMHSAGFFVKKVGYSTIPANSTVTIEAFNQNSKYNYCKPQVFSFVPKAHNQYQITFKPKPGTAGFLRSPICIVTLRNLTRNVDEPVQRRDFVTNFIGQGKCVD